MIRNALFGLLVLVLAGCANGETVEKDPDEVKSSDPDTETIEKVVDENTSPDIEVVETISPDMVTHRYTADHMDRGNHDYYDKPLVIDPNVNSADIQRGDVVFYEGKESEGEVARVVALPGEKVAIKKGQIYIDDKMLDAFYGKAHRAGLNQEAYIEKMKESQGNDYDEKSATEVFELNKEEIELTDDEYYVVSDDWLRGDQTILKAQELIGKVIGYAE